MRYARPLLAVLFDMDGVIVDSMPYHFIAWYEALRSVGIRVSMQDVFLKEGERWDVTLSSLLRRRKLAADTQAMRALFNLRKQAFRRVFRRFIFPGCEELLVCLSAKGYRLGLVTGTPLEEVRSILPARIRRLFSVMVTGTMVKRGKPCPDPYLKAAQLLAVPPAACAVIENAPLGITAARRAGMRCIALPTSLPAEFLRHAHVVARDFNDISRLIDAACSKPS